MADSALAAEEQAVAQVGAAVGEPVEELEKDTAGAVVRADQAAEMGAPGVADLAEEVAGRVADLVEAEAAAVQAVA